jgi:DNA-binding response OmpR family regulator
MSFHILVIEDDEVMCLALASWLEHAGYQVTQANDGTTAIDLLRETMVDVVLSDIVLGETSGLDVLQEAKSHPNLPEVILLTGHASVETSVTALRQGAFDYLIKPCTADQILKTTKKAIDRHISEIRLREAAHTMFTAFSNQFEPIPIPEGLLQLTPEEQAINEPKKMSDTLVIGELVIGKTRHEVTFRGDPARVTPIEFALLRYLAEREGQICFCNDIVHYTHGFDTTDADAQTMLRSHVRNIRRKIDSDYLVNDRGIGYKLVDPRVSPSNP